MKNDNLTILERIRGVRANPSTPETDADPNNPNAIMGWRPIETAPKDDDSILVCDVKIADGFHQVVFYDPMPDKPNWCWSTSDGPTFHKDAFTHWMPLPAPPKA